MTPAAETPVSRIAIVTPIYNDWESFVLLMRDVEAAFPAESFVIDVVAIDDCSIALLPDVVPGGSIASIRVARLKMNVGHQRAIAVGLAQIEGASGYAHVAVMDSDGEDRPDELRRMIDAATARPGTAIVAQRAKRSESRLFRAFYAIYVRLFRLLTGTRIDFGNFSVLAPEHVDRLTHNSNIWNNFAATLIQAKVPIYRLPTVRGVRYAGQSHMRFVSLVVHGLGAISVFSEAVFIRIFMVSGTIFALTVGVVIAVLGVRCFTDWAVPGWTTNVLGFAVILSAQAVMLPVMIAFLLLNNRSTFQNIPKEYAPRIIESVRTIHPRSSAAAAE